MPSTKISSKPIKDFNIKPGSVILLEKTLHDLGTGKNFLEDSHSP